MSSIKYHRPSHKILLTSREPDHSCGLYFFSPPLSAADDALPHWLLGESMAHLRYGYVMLADFAWPQQITTNASPSAIVCGTSG